MGRIQIRRLTTQQPPSLPHGFTLITVISDELRSSLTYVIEGEGLPSWLPGMEPYLAESVKDALLVPDFELPTWYQR